MSEQLKKELTDFAKEYQEGLTKEFHRIKQMNNRQLRKYIENSNWNNILQIIRFLQDEIEQLQQENIDLKQMVNFPSVTITTCPKCGERYSINYCREVYKLKEKNKKLINLISNEIVADFDYDSVLKEELNEERAKNIVLQESKRITENVLADFEKWLEEDFKNETEHPTPQNYCNCYSCKIKALDKLKELKEGKK